MHYVDVKGFRTPYDKTDPVIAALEKAEIGLHEILRVHVVGELSKWAWVKLIYGGRKRVEVVFDHPSWDRLPFLFATTVREKWNVTGIQKVRHIVDDRSSVDSIISGVTEPYHGIPYDFFGTVERHFPGQGISQRLRKASAPHRGGRKAFEPHFLGDYANIGVRPDEEAIQFRHNLRKNGLNFD